MTIDKPIIRRRASVIVTHDDKLLVFRAVDPHDQREMLFLPEGKIEEGETAEEAAERETKEETNYDVKVDPNSRFEKQYPFYWNGKHYHSVTIFFRAHLNQPYRPPGPVLDDDYNKGPLWIPIEDIEKSFAYSPAIRDAVIQLVSR